MLYTNEQCRIMCFHFTQSKKKFGLETEITTSRTVNLLQEKQTNLLRVAHKSVNKKTPIKYTEIKGDEEKRREKNETNPSNERMRAFIHLICQSNENIHYTHRLG